MKAMELVNIGIEASTGAPIVVLREHDDPHRLLPVFVGGFEASSIALGIDGTPPPRPLTHDLMATLVEQLDGHVERVELTGFEDSTFLAEIVLAGPRGEQRVDARPSDAIALAVRVHAPVLVTEEILEEAGGALVTEAVDSEAIDTEAIEREVDEFREFLSDVDPTDFAELEPPSDDVGERDDPGQIDESDPDD